MSKTPDSFDDEELIKAEFDAMVEGLSLDESSPSTYLDELEKFEDHNRFTPPTIPKRSLRDQIRDAKDSFIRWKNNRNNFNPDDGAAL
jgi:hypothetical protein